MFAGEVSSSKCQISQSSRLHYSAATHENDEPETESDVMHLDAFPGHFYVNKFVGGLDCNSFIV